MRFRINCHVRAFAGLVGTALHVLTLAAALTLAPQASAQSVLRVTAIPDESPTELQRKFKPLGTYLEKAVGMRVEFIPVTDYAAAVEALVNRKVELAWFGGFTFVQARNRSNDAVIPLVQRVEDEKFRSVFVTADPSIKRLEDLKGKSLSFGSPSSTSGHLMPRSYLLQAGIDPDQDLRVSFSGAHDATALAVAGGKVAAGALNISVWEKLLADHRIDTSRVHVFFTTPPYHDYNWTVHRDLDPVVRKKLRDAFLALSPDTPQGSEILAMQRATRFVPTRPENYAVIETAARSAGLLK